MEIFKLILKAKVQVLRMNVSDLKMGAQMSSSKIESLEASNVQVAVVLTSLLGRRT